MVGKLRRKFVLVNMILVLLVLLGVFAAQVTATYRDGRAQSVMAMGQALAFHGAEPPKPEIGGGPRPMEGAAGGPGRGPAEAPFSIVPTFSVLLDADGTVLQVSDSAVDISGETLAQAVAAVLEQDKEEGSVAGLSLRYLREERADGQLCVAFADRSWEWAAIRRLLATSLLVGTGAMGVFFLISLFLSHISLRPVRKAWEQQRQFISDASHELKTPLTVILANTAILKSDPSATAEQTEWLDGIDAEAGRMKKLVEDMLYLAKSDEARDKAVCRLPVNLSDLVWECLLTFEPVAYEQGLAMESAVAPNLTISGDEGQLRRLAVILLDNACKYAGEKGVVTVTLERAADKTRLAVHNTGAPIPPQHLDHLFERFYRADSARARSSGGYGLGLAIAKSIVDSHQGKISVTSGEGGTTFTVEF